ncbi:DUF1028 domain-containing protein [Aquibacillus albus]|uniref:Ntn-hydrolase superfamily protein n=1 Tax=Aquibacillus albus TaxID=1168171 RepID=A0ABS2MWU0_9BACI|nr:DUF1028 domain-containing protein [Aquibacillus albus]MBM7570366.1 putative Ntn-hydrolase superfamily protein [Aquibacillus albus]
MNGLELNTFSITARCKKTGMLGVAISTARPAVGGLAPYVKAGVGAISTQALVNPYYGIDGLKLLGEGLSPEEVLSQVTSKDEEKERRQLAIVDHTGNTAGFTGNDTVPWAGHYVGDQFVVAGNMLVGEATIAAMAEAFEACFDKYFPEQLLGALQAGQNAGGDKRGKQSAALYVVHEQEYPIVDIRVDEHATPVEELHRVFEVCQTDLFPYLNKMPTRSKKAGEQD